MERKARKTASRPNPRDEILTCPSSKGPSLTDVLKLMAALTVVGISSAKGSAKARISHVPPASMRQGADASYG